MKLFKSSLSVLIAVGFVATAAQSASAQSFLDSGGIRMGANGPVGSFDPGVGRVNVNGSSASATFTTGALNGRLNVGNDGVYANTNLGSFGFSMPGDVNDGRVFSPNQGGVNFGNGAGVGPQGQVVGGYSTGIGSGGTAFSSQGTPGDRAHTSDTTNTKFQGNQVRGTHRNNNAIFERQRTNLLSTFSVDQRSVPSGSFDYGFQTGAGSWMGTARGALNGWYLPRTSTGSFDGNIVSP